MQRNWPRYGALSLIVQKLGGTFGVQHSRGLSMAYCSEFRAGQGPFSKTLEVRRRVLPQASLEGRALSQEPYLRPTLYCDSHAPEVVALADELRQGARNDWEYAQAIYNFVCSKIIFTIVPLPGRGVVETLEVGCGTCLDKLNVLVALARAGGIPARFCFVDAPFSTTHMERVEPDHAGRSEAPGADADRHRGLEMPWRQRQLHPYAELEIGNFWIPADPTLDDEGAAGLGQPLPRLGYDSLMLQDLAGGMIDRKEEIPAEHPVWIARRFFCRHTCGSLQQCLNLAYEELRTRGGQILKKDGRDEYIRQTRRFYMPLPGVTELDVAPPL